MSTPAAYKFKLHDLGTLMPLLNPVAAFWVAIADQLGMESLVPAIRGTSSNTNPPECLRDLLVRWISHGNSTLEVLCQSLRNDPEIIGGAEVANKLQLEKQFQN